MTDPLPPLLPLVPNDLPRGRAGRWTDEEGELHWWVPTGILLFFILLAVIEWNFLPRAEDTRGPRDTWRAPK